MKKRWVYLLISVLSVFVLASCGNSKYNKSIDKIFTMEKQQNVWSDDEKKHIQRGESEVWIFDNGKYVEMDFHGINYKNKPIIHKNYYKKDSKGAYKMADTDTEEYIKENAKLVYHEKNGKQVKE